MTSYDGSELQFLVGDGGSPVEAFHALGSLQRASLSVERALSASDTVAGDGWQQRHGSGGLRGVRLSAEGVGSSSIAEAALRAHAYAGTAFHAQVLFPDEAVLVASFVLRAYETTLAGEELRFRLVVESAGSVSYTA